MLKILTKKDLRSDPRVSFSFPVGTKDGDPNAGEVLNISNGGLCMSLDTKYTGMRRISLNVVIPSLHRSFDFLGERVWTRTMTASSKILIGLKFVNPRSNDLEILHRAAIRNTTLKNTGRETTNRIWGYLYPIDDDLPVVDSFPILLVDEAFKQQVRDLAEYLESVKYKLKNYKSQLDEQQEVVFLRKTASDVFPVLDNFFDRLWESFASASKEAFAAKKEYYEAEVSPYLGDRIESNSYIRERPLGYVGDFVTMNFIYDYHDKAFFGKSLYAKLINRYTCNIDVAHSNIARKDYIKRAIQEVIKTNINPGILSIGSGSAREIIEMLEERKISRATIHLLDLEKKAVLYVQDKLSCISYDRSKIDIHFHMMDLMEVVKDNRFLSFFPDIDLVYASGIFDYLSARVAKKTYARLFTMTKGSLLVFNMSMEHARHRAYYEVFGNWHMYHRRKEELLGWGRDLPDVRSFSVENPVGCNSYWILKASKK